MSRRDFLNLFFFKNWLGVTIKCVLSFSFLITQVYDLNCEQMNVTTDMMIFLRTTEPSKCE